MGDSDNSNDYTFSRTLSRRSGILFCEEVNIRSLQLQLAEKFENKPGASPFFVYSKQQIVENVDAYRSAFASANIPYLIGYSLKANYNPHILRLITSAPQTGVVAVSGHEVQLAIAEGIDADRIIFNGNGKQPWELAMAVRVGCLVNVDSLFDVRRLLRTYEQCAGRRPDGPVRVLLRLNPNIDAEVHPFLSTGLAKSKFGIDDSQLPEALDIIKHNQSSLQLVGLHCHLGSTIANTFVFSECLELMLNIANELRHHHGFTELRYINLGGGLGIDYQRHIVCTRPPQCNLALSADELSKRLKEFCETVKTGLWKRDPSTVDEICRLVQQIDSRNTSDAEAIVQRVCNVLRGHTVLLSALKAIFPNSPIEIAMPSPADLVDAVKDRLKVAAAEWPSLTVVVEPGRSIVGNTCTFITRVLGWKRNGNQNYIVVDGSMTEVIRPALYGAYHHIELTEPVTNQEQPNKDVFDVVGPVCECGDFLGKNRWLAHPNEGCGLAVFDTGAYCASMASNYNMRPRPLEVLVDGSSWQIIRQSETLEDIVRTFHASRNTDVC
jgi:diaminopimelate decarboxylase